MTPRKLPYKLLKDITAGFSKARLIGRGTFGDVYMGFYEDGQVIAVKILQDLAAIDDRNFQIEFGNLAKTRHRNIIKIVGYCNESENVIVEYNGRNVLAKKMHVALCFEYCQNGSLLKYLSDCGVDWCARYKMMKGTCDGLRYLHEGLANPILHLDLKPDNILLDENITPKISDFGLSRLLGEQRTHMTMAPLGTVGYLSPEFISHQIISREFDIYSLGVIMLKMITGYRDYSLVEGDRSPEELIEILLGKWRERLQATYKSRMVDGYCQQLKRCIEIALRCIEKDRCKRPQIGDIVRSLEETESWIHEDSELLDVQPMELRFPFKPKKHASCLLQLHNKQEDHVAFRLVSESPLAKYLSELPLYGIVPPGCTYTIALTTCKQPPRPPSSESDEGFVLHSIGLSNRSYLHQ